VSWYVALKNPWRRAALPELLTVANNETGEIVEFGGGFHGLFAGYEDRGILLGRIAKALGPDVLRRWEDEGEDLDLAAEVAALRGVVAGYRRALDEALNSGDGSYRP